MTPDEQAFIDAAIVRDCATHRYHQAARAALSVAEADKATALKIRQEASEAQIAASIEFDEARKRVTDPVVRFLTPRID